MEDNFIQRLNDFLEENTMLGLYQTREHHDHNLGLSFVCSFVRAGHELAGHEVVWSPGRPPLWIHCFHGGMAKKYQDSREFTDAALEFQQRALSDPAKRLNLQPRRNKEFSDNLKGSYWRYTCRWRGDIGKFEGFEEVFYKEEKVFGQEFVGGLMSGNERIVAEILKNF